MTRSEQKHHQVKMKSGRNIYKSSKYNMGRVGGTHSHRGSPPLKMSEMAPFGKVKNQMNAQEVFQEWVDSDRTH
jgi:hypothetical protein